MVKDIIDYAVRTIFKEERGMIRNEDYINTRVEQIIEKCEKYFGIDIKEENNG